MNLRPLLIAALPLALCACDDAAFSELQSSLGMSRPAPVAAVVPAASETTAPIVSPLKQPIEVSAGAVAPVPTAQSETVDLKSFSAFGAGWTADVADGKAVVKREGLSDATVNVERIVYSGGVEFIGVMSGKPMTIRASAPDCRASDGSDWPLSVTFRSAGLSGPGCAGTLGSVKGPMAVAPPAAPAPAKSTLATFFRFPTASR